MASDARWALLMTDGSSGNVVTNNILLNKNPTRGSMTVEADSRPALSDFNVVQDLFQMDGYNGNFAAWQSFSGGQDAHSIVVNMADPPAELGRLFVDPAANNYHLKSGSVAIDAGDATHAPAVDIFQHARPSGAGVDIGAYEYSALVPAVNVQFEWKNVIGYESIGMAEVAVTRTSNTEGSIIVNWQTGAGTAAPSSDYQGASGQLVFNPGETRKTFVVFVNNDTQIESLETVALSLTATDAATDNVVATDASTLNIVSDDVWTPGRFEFSTPTVTVDETAGTATITVKRLDGSNGSASVNVATKPFTPPKVPNWIQRNTVILYPPDSDAVATAGADYTATQVTLNFADGETSKSITVPILNDAWYEGDEAFLVTLSNPTNGASLGSQSTTTEKVRIHSDDAKLPGTFVFASDAYTVVEGTPFVNVTINRLNGGNVEASVRLYDTGAGNGTTTTSAWAPSDYGWLPQQLTFAPGELSKTISIPIVDDTSTEIDEVFSIQLYSPTNDATVGNPSKTYVTIQDNESTFYFQGATSAAYSFESVEGTGKMSVTVVRQGSLATPASVKITTSDGSAIGGVDYTPVNVTLNFAAGEASKTINIPVINDTLVEPKENFSVNMSNCVGAQQGSWTWSAYIIDDDVAAIPGKFEFSSATFSGSEAGGVINVTVNRVNGSSGTVTVQYATSDGATGFSNTAWSGSDYSSKSGTLTFAPGETSKVISIPVTNDTSVEGNEVFSISLKNPAGGATLGSITKAVVTIIDDDSAIEFGTSNYVVDESAGYVTITLVRKGSTTGTATVDLNISSGSAEAGKDFIKPTSPTVTFADGESIKTIQIQIIDDVFKEADESFYLSLSNATNAKLGSYLYGNVKILAND
jgi:hypothetical protein